jgi:WD40 repeat protein/serine/threonine protein kinase/DNA-binding XRE family transcriptional regulator
MEETRSFGRMLKDYRKACDLTQEQLAEKVSCSVETIKKIEAGKLRPGKQLAELLAARLTTTPEQRVAFIKAARAELVVDRHAVSVPLPIGPIPPRTVDTQHRQLKGYALREQIGSGGFGVVYRAEQPGIGREVAIKIIQPEYADRIDFIRRFEVEAQLVARLEHPYIVSLYDYWREPSSAYLVMRYVRGSNLSAALRSGPWSIDTTRRLLEQLTAALAYAHRHQVVHRDLKPANILVDEEGNAYLADFGIAKDLGVPVLGEQPQAHTMVGSPAYLSPEQIRAEPITPRTDIYSLGLLLYEILAGTHPFADLTPAEILYKQLYEPLPFLHPWRPDLPAAIDTVIQRATAKRADDRYPDAVSMLAAFIQSIGTERPQVLPESSELPSRSYAALVNADAADTLPDPAELSRHDNVTLAVENPYKGLRPFSEADAPDFFGREALTLRLLERLAEETELSRFLAVVGPSGSGKSSLVRAGLVPALRGGALPSSERWFVVAMFPGAQPLEELEAALLRVAVNPPASLLAQLWEDERGLVRAVKRTLPDDMATELVLIIDQFEELFTFLEDEDTRIHILRSLLAAVRDPRSRMRIVITLRADFYDRPLLYSGFGELVHERTEVVVPLTPDELERAVVGPAQRAGLVMETGLATSIIRDANDQPGALPLLQYALTELFEQCVGHMFTLEVYVASGGVFGALARRADDIYSGLDVPQQAAARQLFLRLVSLGEGVEDTRRRVLWTELIAVGRDRRTLEMVIESYGRYRLLTFDHDPVTRGSTVEIAHEALIRRWGRLRGWLEASREDLRVQRRLAMAAVEWHNAGRDSSFLAAGARLAQFETLASDADLGLNQDEHEYLSASSVGRDRQVAAERERQARELELARQSDLAQRRVAKGLHTLVGGLVLFLLVAIGLAAFAFDQRAQAINNAATAVMNLRRAEALRLAAEARRLAQSYGDPVQVALLSIRSVQSQYLPEGDQMLVESAALVLPLHLLGDHDERVLDAAFSPDGRSVMTGSSKGNVRIWDTQTGTELRQFTGQTSPVTSIAVSPDGRHALTGGSDGTARLWDAQAGTELRSFEVHGDGISQVGFSADGVHVLTSGYTNIGSDTAQATRVELWDIQTGQLLHSITEDSVGYRAGMGPSRAAFSPDGRTLLLATITDNSDELIQIWDAQTFAVLRTFDASTKPSVRPMVRAALSPDEHWILVSIGDGTTRLWDAQTHTELRQLIGHTGVVTSIAFSPDSRYVLTGGSDGTARLWDVQTSRQLLLLSGHARSPKVVFSPNGRYVLTTDTMGMARLWDLQPYNALVGHTGSITDAAFSADSKYLLTSSNDGTARLWDADTGAELRRFINSPEDTVSTSAIQAAKFSPDSRYVLTVSNDVSLWNTRSQEVRAFGIQDDPQKDAVGVVDAAYEPDGKFVLTVSVDNTVRAWNPQTGEMLYSFRLKEQSRVIWDMIISPDSKYILTCDDSETARLWDVRTGQQVRLFADPTIKSSFISVAYSPDSKSVLTGDDSGTARLWDMQTSRLLHTFSNHSGSIGHVAFSPDGRYILTSGADGTIRLWDAQTGAELRHFTFTRMAVGSAAVVAMDGKRLLMGGPDPTVRLLNLDYHDMIASICTHLPRDFTDAERAQYGIPDTQPTCPHSSP